MLKYAFTRHEIFPKAWKDMANFEIVRKSTAEARKHSNFICSKKYY